MDTFFCFNGQRNGPQGKVTLVPYTPGDKAALIEEIRRLKNDLKIAEVLAGWGLAVKTVTSRTTAAEAFLLVLDIGKMTLLIKPYKVDELGKASDDYIKVEKDNKGNPHVQAVLVSVSSVDALQKAYPNYFLDTVAFTKAVNDTISGK